MTNFDGPPWMMPAIAVAVVVVLWMLYRYVFGRRTPLENALSEIAFERIEALVIPKADEGEIQIDRLVLTTKGLLILEVKDVQGTVFGSDKMSDWTVIADDRRYTFPNPQPALYDRIAAVRQIVRQVPVEGRVVFLDGAEFTKGVPDLVTDIEGLLAEFGEADKNAAKYKIESFKPHWELIRKALG